MASILRGHIPTSQHDREESRCAGAERDPPLCYTEGEVDPQTPTSLPLPVPGAEPQGLPAIRCWVEDVLLSAAVVGSRYGVKGWGMAGG